MKNDFIVSDEITKKIIDEIKKTTKEYAYSLTIQPNITPTLTDSKFGGLPYWDFNKTYPTNPDGKKLILLAQINFDNANVDAPLPQKGMLQFFIDGDDVFGLDFDTPNKQETFRVVYHENIDKTVTAKQVIENGIPDGFGDDYETPVFKEVTVDIIKKEIYIDLDDYRFEKAIRDAIKKVCGQELDEDDNPYKFLKNYEKEFGENVGGHWLLGYPFFTQDDPRRYNDEYKVYDTLLFQMDSEMSDNGYDYILWGDCGVGNFFINHKKLEECDFSDVLYNWDCC